MRVLILCGSPKGVASVSLRYGRYLALRFPEHSFVEAQVAVRNLDFEALVARVREADLLLFAFPLYVGLVHADLKGFFEGVEDRGLIEAFAGRPALLLATSIHWHDHTAMDYVRGMLEDWGMSVLGAYSAHMRDLLNPLERGRLEGFAQMAFARLGRGERPRRQTLARQGWDYVYPDPGRVEPVGGEGLRAIVVTDGRPGSGIRNMVEAFSRSFAGELDLVELDALAMKGSCRGCLQCGFDNACIYGESDGVQDFYRRRLQRADLVVWAFAIRDRYYSAQVKTLQDRRFLDTHQPQALGKQVLHLVSGPLSTLPGLRQMLEHYDAFNGANQVAVVTDEARDAGLITQAIREALAMALDCHRSGYIAPGNFLVVGGAKIFRDEIWGHLRFVFQGDHRHYRSHGLYDFPQRAWKTRLMNAVMIPLTKLKPVKRSVQVNMLRHMTQPLDAVLGNLGGPMNGGGW